MAIPEFSGVPVALFVIPAQAEINVRTFLFLSFPRRRESSEVSHDHAVGIRSFLMSLPMTTDLVITTAYWIPGLRPG